MQEFIYEETSICAKTSAKKTRSFITGIFSVTGFIFAFLWFIIGCFTIKTGDTSLQTFLGLMFLILPPVAFVVLSVICIRLKNNTYVDYDYSVVSDSIRISKVFKGVRRVDFIVFNTYHIERIGRAFSELYNKYEQDISIRKVYCTENEYCDENKEFFYILINFDSEKQLLVLECTNMLISNILKTARNTVLDKELK